MKMKRVLTWLLVVCMTLSLDCVGVEAAGLGGNLGTSTGAQLEQVARAYVRDFVDKCYLYEVNDLTANTLHSFVSEKAASAGFDDMREFAQNMGDLTLNGDTISVRELCRDLQLVDDYAEYLSYTRSIQGISLYDFTYYCDLVETKVESDWATVHLYTTVLFYYEPGGEQAVGCDHYYVDFAKVDGKWQIARVLPEEMVAYGITSETFELQTSIASFNQILPQLLTTEESIITSDEQDRETTRQTLSRNYNPDNAVAYAFTYTTSTYSGSGDVDGFLNENFRPHASSHCQAFVSQCIWAGLGGCDNYDMIRSWLEPMDVVGSSDLWKWHAAGYAGVSTSSWSNTHGFAEYLGRTAAETTGSRLTASQIKLLNTGSSFATVTGAPATLVGAVLHVEGSDGMYGHAIIITAATGTSPSQIRYCGNSPMRKSYLLSGESSYITNEVRVMVPSAFKKVACGDMSCTYSPSSTGVSCLCTRCGNSRLRIEGTMLCPVPKGSTQIIEAMANVNCYRIAISITAPGSDSVPSWTNYTNTSSVARSYTFSETGLYTIEIVARDISENEATSHTQKHIFKVRVY